MKKKNDKNATQLREKAEAQIANSAKVEIAVKSDQKTFHELHVHQIELEMQNEELLRAQLALEDSCAHYLQLYDFAPVAYLTLSEQGVITEANLKSTHLLGVARNHLIKRRFADFVATEDVDRWQRYFNHANQCCEKHGCELALRYADGSSFHANLDYLQIKPEGGPAKLHVTLTNITERKLADQFLRIAATAFEMQGGIMVTDADKVILRVNQAFTRITGYSAEEAIGRKPSLLRSGLHDKEFYQAMWAAVAIHGFWQGEIWDKRKNGEVFPIWLINTAVSDENKRITHFVGSFTDITTQKQIEQFLLNSRLYLESQIGVTKEKLGKCMEEATEVKTALNVVIKQQKIHMSDAQHQLSDKLRETVTPFLDKLKHSGLAQNQVQLLKIIEANLQELTTVDKSADKLSAVYRQLTPVEIQVASMVRQGLSTKTIAVTLSLSPETISVHRKHIRKKLGLDNNAMNLRSYLSELDNLSPSDTSLTGNNQPSA